MLFIFSNIMHKKVQELFSKNEMYFINQIIIFVIKLNRGKCNIVPGPKSQEPRPSQKLGLAQHSTKGPHRRRAQAQFSHYQNDVVYFKCSKLPSAFTILAGLSTPLFGIRENQGKRKRSKEISSKTFDNSFLFLALSQQPNKFILFQNK